MPGAQDAEQQHDFWGGIVGGIAGLFGNCQREAAPSKAPAGVLGVRTGARGRCSRPVSPSAESRSHSRAGSDASDRSQERPLSRSASSSAGSQRMSRFVNKGSRQAPRSRSGACGRHRVPSLAPDCACKPHNT